jgi:hypothetical protein
MQSFFENSSKSITYLFSHIHWLRGVRRKELKCVRGRVIVAPRQNSETTAHHQEILQYIYGMTQEIRPNGHSIFHTTKVLTLDDGHIG